MTIHSTCRLVYATAACAALIGCKANEIQSAVHPAGPAAAEIAWLWWLMFWAFSAVFFLVLALLTMAILRRLPNDAIPPFGRTGFIVAGGIALPVIVVSPLLILSLRTSAALHLPDDALTIEVRGHMWWWEVRYPDHGIVTANEIHIPAGEPVRLELTSADVIHSFWVPRLNGKRDLIPGLQNTFWIEADQPGRYRGQCAEYCGTQHAHMAFFVIALPPNEFRAWVVERQQPIEAQLSEAQQRGAEVTREAGCTKCHTIAGIKAQNEIGPDLTHIGSRETLGAALIPNTPGNLAGWIANAAALKPGIEMPPTYLPPEDLLALVAYLESLK
jgi:cytochrome c oxidase subunit II